MRLSSHDDVESFKGFDELTEILNEYGEKADRKSVQKVLEAGAQDFVNILLKLPKPKSKLNYPGYTHLIDTFTYAKNKNGEVEVGWGKYYGPMVDRGTIKMDAIPHLTPAWDSNKDMIYKTMIEKIRKEISL